MQSLLCPAPAVETTTLEIKRATYEVTPIDPGFAGVAAVRLVKLSSGESYDVVLTRDGRAECDCPSYEFTYRGTAGTCKHGSACLAAGLLLAPVCGGSPAVAVAVAPAAVAPVTPADRKRAAYFGLTIPKAAVAPMAVEPAPTPAPAPVVEAAPEIPAEGNPRDSWPEWTDEIRWSESAPVVVKFPALASDDESTGIDLTGFSNRISVVGGEMIVESGPATMTASEFSAWMAAHNGDAGGPPMGWVKNGPVSVLANLTPIRFDFARVDAIGAGADATVARVRGELDRPARPRRFVPTPEDQAEAAALFADSGRSCPAGEQAPPLGERSWPRHVAPPSRSFTANRMTDRQVHRRGVC